MSTLETLIAARKLIESPRRWTQGTSARDKRGVNVPSTSLKAVCWCAYGAIWRISGFDKDQLSTKALRAAMSVEYDHEAFEFNDRHTHKEVLAAFDEAIEKARA